LPSACGTGDERGADTPFPIDAEGQDSPLRNVGGRKTINNYNKHEQRAAVFFVESEATRPTCSKTTMTGSVEKRKTNFVKSNALSATRLSRNMARRKGSMELLRHELRIRGFWFDKNGN